MAWNQKLTVEVVTPDGVKSSSSVVGYSATVGKQFASGNEIAQGLQGEATVVEVAPGKYLFALLGGAEEIAVWTFYDRLPKNDALAMQQAVAAMPEAGNVPPDRYPMLVTFADINDPKTAQEVKPDQFASIFGPGYSLKSITLEITEEPVTEGKVETVLSWVSDLKGSVGKDMNLPYNHLLNKINDGSFRQGASK